jgi:hypothetical protein
MSQPSCQGNKPVVNDAWIETEKNIPTPTTTDLNQRNLQILKAKLGKEECELFIKKLNEKIKICKITLIPIMGEEYFQR